MIAYKFLSAGAVGLFSRHAWPTPTAGAPGEWVSVEGEIRPCLNGIHACVQERLVEWLDDELWEIELDGPVLEADGELIAAEGRLIGRLEAWNDEAARAFAADCIDNTVALAAESLAKAGREVEAEALLASRSEPRAHLNVLQFVGNGDAEQTSSMFFLADVARLERGGRPELDAEAPSTEDGGPTPAALAANLSYVCAHITAQLAEEQSAGAYEESFESERRRQAAWLAQHLQLDR